jgi:hypothetical protein
VRDHVIAVDRTRRIERYTENAADEARRGADQAERRRLEAALRGNELGAGSGSEDPVKKALERVTIAKRAARSAQVRAARAHTRSASAHAEAARIHRRAAEIAESRGKCERADEHRKAAAKALEAAAAAREAAHAAHEVAEASGTEPD